MPATAEAMMSSPDDIAARSGYTQDLLEVARDDPHFIATVERALSDFVRRGGSNEYVFDPMPPEQRAVIHALAQAHYGLNSTSRGFEPQRCVVVTRAVTTHVPRIPLSFFSDVLRSHMLRIGSLTTAVKTQHITNPLRTAGLLQQCKVVWVDDATALVACDAPDTMTRARTVLLKSFPDITIVQPAPRNGTSINKEEVEEERHADAAWDENEDTDHSTTLPSLPSLPSPPQTRQTHEARQQSSPPPRTASPAIETINQWEILAEETDQNQ